MPKRILLVDDEKVFSNYLNQILSRKGYQTDVANNGEEALARCEQANYDVILSDIKMPKMDGLELLRRVKQKAAAGEGAWNPSVVMMTAHGSVETAVEAMKPGR